MFFFYIRFQSQEFYETIDDNKTEGISTREHTNTSTSPSFPNIPHSNLKNQDKNRTNYPAMYTSLTCLNTPNEQKSYYEFERRRTLHSNKIAKQ